MKRVLYVEDDLRLKDVLATLIGRILKAEIVSASNGEEALALFKESKFDLIITDMFMPIMSGIELSTEIRKISEKLPIILLSGHVDRQLKEQAEECGIKHIVSKPIDAFELGDLVKTLW